MTIQLACPAADKFHPDPAFLKHKRRPEFIDSEPKLKRAGRHTVELPVAGGNCLER